MSISQGQGPAAKYKHHEHVIKNINREYQEQITTGQRVADWIRQIIINSSD